MHINPGVVDGAKLLLSYGTAAAAFGYTAKLAWESVREKGYVSFGVRTLIASIFVFVFFEVLPHYPIGVSEVHLILGSTLFLILGPAPTAIGLAFGLLVQGVFFAPFDLPQYGMNVTTLLVPLFVISGVAKKVIAPTTAYVDLKYGQALALSTAYQGGVVIWVAFWSIYGEGMAALAGIATFGSAYMLVVAIEPLVDLLVLAGAKSLRGLRNSGLVTDRLYQPA
ncbi:MAG: energy-coupling factor ABC transporter permease [Deltaproteobacteria bacterium]